MQSTESAELEARIREQARALGFDRVGFAPVRPSDHADLYRWWIGQGMAGEMGYLGREGSVEKRIDPARAVEGARSAIVVGSNYFPGGTPTDEGIEPDRANIARYARNLDYHDLLKNRLIELQGWIENVRGPLQGRAYVDAGPVLERELANRAGIGWFGRNTTLIAPQAGSYFFLGTILTDLLLVPDEPLEKEFCGSCHRCISACPTDALLGRNEAGAPVMDARRCISYLTIEQRGPIPREFRRQIGNRIFGCDICQEVCPHNNPKFVQITTEPAFLPRPGVHGAQLIELMGLDQAAFSRRFKGSPIKRTKRRGLLRNVAVALGNWGSDQALEVLAEALTDDEELVRGHAAWALGEIGGVQAAAALEARKEVETSAWVREEIRLARDMISSHRR